MGFGALAGGGSVVVVRRQVLRTTKTTCFGMWQHTTTTQQKPYQNQAPPFSTITNSSIRIRNKEMEVGGGSFIRRWGDGDVGIGRRGFSIFSSHLSGAYNSLTDTRFPKRRPPPLASRRKRSSLRPSGPFAWVNHTVGNTINPSNPNEGSVKRRNEKKRRLLRRAFILVLLSSSSSSSPSPSPSPWKNMAFYVLSLINVSNVCSIESNFVFTLMDGCIDLLLPLSSHFLLQFTF